MRKEIRVLRNEHALHENLAEPVAELEDVRNALARMKYAGVLASQEPDS